MPNQIKKRITADDVRGIIADRDSGMSRHAIASKYHCSASMVWKICAGETRRDVDGDERDDGAELTAEQLDALIAERMNELPHWWRTESQRCYEPRLPNAVSRGLGMYVHGKRAKE